MLASDQFFLFLGQFGSYRVGRTDGTGRPEFWVPRFKEAYAEMVLSEAPSVPDLQAYSDEIFQILRSLIKFDRMHEYVQGYLDTEDELRKKAQSPLTYDTRQLRQALEKASFYARAQYSKDEKSKLKFEEVPDDLLTVTGGRLVRIKDSLFHVGPSSQIPEAAFYNHKGDRVYWRDS